MDPLVFGQNILPAQSVEGIVDEVAEDRGEVAIISAEVAREVRGVHRHLDARLGGLGDLGQQQGREDGVVEGHRPVPVDPVEIVDVLGREVDGLVDVPGLEQGHDHVQPVRVFVGLRAQGIGEGPHGDELAGEFGQLRVIAHGHDPRIAGRLGGLLIDDEDAVVGVVDLVAGPPAGREQIVQRLGQVEFAQRHLLRRGGARVRVVTGGRHAQQFPGLGVDEHDPAGSVDEQQTFGDRREHGGVEVEHAAQLVGAVVAGDPAQASRCHPRRADAEDEGEHGDADEPFALCHESLADRIGGAADDDGADDRVGPHSVDADVFGVDRGDDVHGAVGRASVVDEAHRRLALLQGLSVDGLGQLIDGVLGDLPGIRRGGLRFQRLLASGRAQGRRGEQEVDGHDRGDVEAVLADDVAQQRLDIVAGFGVEVVVLADLTGADEAERHRDVVRGRPQQVLFAFRVQLGELEVEQTRREHHDAHEHDRVREHDPPGRAEADPPTQAAHRSGGPLRQYGTLLLRHGNHCATRSSALCRFTRRGQSAESACLVSLLGQAAGFREPD